MYNNLSSLNDIKHILKNKNSKKGDLEKFIEKLNVGDKYKVKWTEEFHLDDAVMHEEIIVLKKFPHFVQTNKGNFTYNDLIIGEKL